MFSRKGLGRIGLLNPPATRGGAALLQGESGLGIDFSDSSGVGSVSVIGHTTNYNNIPVDSFLTNSGTSPKLVRNAAGTYVFSAHNLGLQSSDWSNASWTKSANASATATRVTVSSAASPSQGITQDTTTVADFRYAARIKAKYVSVQWVILRLDSTGEQHCWFDILNGVKGTEGANSSGTITGPDSDGYYTLVVTAPANGAVGTNAFYLTAGDNGLGAAVGAVDLKEFQHNRGTTPTTYLATTTAATFAVPMDYDSGWAALVEPAATNLCLQSQAFGTTWANTNTDEPTTNNAAPDGSATADEIAATSAANQAFAIYQGFTGLTAGNTATCSVFLKAGTNATMAQLAWDANGTGADGCFCNFNLSTGAKGTVTALAAGTATSSVITSVGNGWYRCSITGKIAVGTVGRFTISIVDLITEAVFGAANLADNDSIIAWQGQVEAAASSASLVATSPVPTFAATVTRAADAINVATSAFPWNATAGTILQTFTPLGSVSGHWWNISDGTSNERFACYSNIDLFIADGGVQQQDVDFGNITADVLAKTGAAWAVNDTAAVLNGGSVGTDASVTLPTVTTLRIGTDQGGGGVVNMRVRSLVYLPRRATNAELQTRTAA